ncbi:ATP-dependent RNA helicase DHX29-like protein [Perkinsela sp. CCAP 1560/4]|nr:ATP-dependent RNA helicase DHX29-like protein [Perkinsela sp. CCAP 1560/4]KNH09164.1 ATP-dependent RNA helicase DHX29-like protein [Perkinsela sp. CCAP 1560/4]|eukprot:KNH04374.1 ATP-dependent RNA helicase DHX29-like protein [Perkinsela sp. CCAP 1560/4]
MKRYPSFLHIAHATSSTKVLLVNGRNLSISSETFEDMLRTYPKRVSRVPPVADGGMKANRTSSRWTIPEKSSFAESSKNFHTPEKRPNDRRVHKILRNPWLKGTENRPKEQIKDIETTDKVSVVPILPKNPETLLSANIERAASTGIVDSSGSFANRKSVVFDAICLHIIAVMARVHSPVLKLKSSIEKRMNKDELGIYRSLLKEFSELLGRQVYSLDVLFENIMPAPLRESAKFFLSLNPKIELTPLGKDRYKSCQIIISKNSKASPNRNSETFLHRSFTASTLRMHRENIQRELSNLQEKLGDSASAFSQQTSTSFSDAMPLVNGFRTDLKRVGKREAEPCSFPTFFGNLQVLHHYESIDASIKANTVTILRAATGSGKSTGVPMILLDSIARDAASGGRGRIICVQPRRIAATSLAGYIKDVRREETGQGDVGSIIRFDSNVRFATDVLIYMTTGIFLRMLMGTETFENVSHIIIDEIHERSLEIDIILLLLREKIIHSKDSARFPRVILMSATFDTAKFEKYFADCNVRIDTLLIECERKYPVEVIPLEGVLKETARITDSFLGFEHRNFGILEKPYKQFKSSRRRAMEAESREQRGITSPDMASLRSQYALNDFLARELYQCHHKALSNDFELNYKLILKTILAIVFGRSGGTILVFLPTMGAIKTVEAALIQLRLENILRIIKLHSKLERSSMEIYQPAPPGKRKVILSTNIAQTSLTIPDVVYVVDTGVHHQRIIEKDTGLPHRCDGRISKACATQRAGRTGRVSKGTVYQLFSSWEYKNLMDDFLLPEIQRTLIEHICLHMVSGGWALSPQSLLQRAIDPPSAKSVEKALVVLKDLCAIEALPDSTAFRSTNVGHMMSKFEMDPACAKMLVLAKSLGILPIALYTVPLLELDPVQSYSSEMEQRSAKLRSLCANSRNDFLALFSLLKSASRQETGLGQWCTENEIQYQEMENALTNRKRLLDISRRLYGEVSDGMADVSYRSLGKVPLVYYAALSGSFQSTVASTALMKKGHGILARFDGQEYPVSITTPSAVSAADVSQGVRSPAGVIPLIFNKCFKRKNLSRKIQTVCMGDLLTHILMSPNVEVRSEKLEIVFNDGLVVLKCTDSGQADELKELRVLIRKYVEVSTGLHQFRTKQAREAVLRLIEDSSMVRTMYPRQAEVFGLGPQRHMKPFVRPTPEKDDDVDIMNLW